MSYIFRSDSVQMGDRVVVRRIRDDSATDIIGHVTALAPLTVRPQLKGGMPSEEPEVVIAPEELKIVKKLSPRTIRNSQIRNVEAAYAKAFPGIEHRWSTDGQWLLRAGDGITERSNSATPLGPNAGFVPVPIAEITEFYRSHELPVQLHLPERIAKSAERLAHNSPEWKLGPDIVVMTRSLDVLEPTPTPVTCKFEVLERPDKEWLAMYHFRGRPLPAQALNLLSSEIEGTLGFARFRDRASGQTLAITRATLTESPDSTCWLGYSAVEVEPAYRRQGLGTALGYQVMAWAQAQGADSAYLQVIGSNDAGIGLYEKLGFLEHHRHRYAQRVG